MHLNQSKIKGIQAKIDAELKASSDYEMLYQKWCLKLHSTPDKRIPSLIYHSISTHSHAGKYPIECHVKDRMLSPAEWAFIIAIFEKNLPGDAFVVYDHHDKIMIP
jgi:hypothetical protein